VAGGKKAGEVHGGSDEIEYVDISAMEVCSLSRGERVGVRGYALSLAVTSHPNFSRSSKIDLSQ
jgi:hypothetical protein